ncbi:hypothetical protein KJZ71_04295 [Patescibacteria group bacterium]|nr:hypothetical protein [Patescibacteria group bacterium]
MNRRTVLFGLSAIFAIAFVFFIFQKADAAFPACQCSCISSEDTQNLLRVPQPDAASCSATVCPAACSEIGSTLVSTEYNASSNRCVCGCSKTTQSWTYAKKTPGSASCLGDCSEACGGLANVDSNQNQSLNTVQIACITSSDCSVGQFSAYSDVSCIFQPVGPNENPSLWPPDGKKPVCQIEPTKENADKECQNYGGVAKNGICTFISSGENPEASFKSRPYIKADGTYANIDFTNTYGTADALNTVIDASTTKAPNVAGLCELYGKTQGSGRYLCIKSKKNTCGTVTPPSSLTIKTKSSYECVLTSTLDAQGLDKGKLCFPSTGGPAGTDYADLCINKPGSLCCAQAAGGCLGNQDCSLDGSMICKGANLSTLTYGTCEWNVVCDSTAIDRRCRYASPAEVVNNEICSPESILQSVQRRCPNQSQYCCKAPDAQALSSCAADMSTNLTFNSGGRSYKDYTCITGTQIPDSEYVPGTKTLKHWEDGGNCLRSDIPAGGQAGGTTITRCGSGQICCNAKQLQFAQDVKDFYSRPGGGQNCGIGTPQKICTAPSAIVKDEAEAQKRGYPTLDAYYAALANSPGCDITPYSPSSFTNNKECFTGFLCCIPEYSTGAGFCAKDSDCDPNNYCAPNSSNPGACKKCDLGTRLCVPGGLLEQQLSDSSCFVRATAQGAKTDQALNVSGATKESYSCQLVFEESLGVNGCVPQGCDAENAAGGAESGATFQCCPPGVGAAPGAAAAAPTPAAAADVIAPGTIGLPACIRSGQCQLGDIIWTGAQFANFLISISGAVFLAIFVYGGFLYLTAGGSDDRVGKAKKMIVQSTIAMVLMMGGFIFIRFIQTSLIATSAGQDVLSGRACAELSDDKTQYACIFLTTDPQSDPKGYDAEAKDRGCERGKCPGASLCCPL